MPKHRIEVDEGGISISDAAPQPKRSRSSYSKIAPSHIPDVDVSMAVRKGTEKLDLCIPEVVVSKLPRLKQIAAQGLHAAAGLVQLDEDGLVSLPGGIWGLLLVLKLIQVDDFDMGAVLVSDAEPESAAAAPATAQYLGCEDVSSRVRLWLREEIHKGTVNSDVIPAHDTQSRCLAVRQVLDALPDEEFRLQCDHPNQLLDTTAEALTLPARLKVKWLRANAVTSLDLSTPGDAWSTHSWQSLVACLHAVPALERLCVRLPRGQSTASNAGNAAGRAATAKQGTGARASMPEPPAHSNVSRDRRQSAPASSRPAPATPTSKPEAFVTTEALAALAHVSTALPALQHLHLVDSPISVNDVATFSAALASFSASLTRLCVEVWRAKDLSCKLPQEYPQAARQQVLSAIARLQLLQKLEIPDWKDLAREDCEGGSCLSRLQRLTEVAVRGYPCGSCGGGQCRHFARALPFRSLDAGVTAEGEEGPGRSEGQENAGGAAAGALVKQE